MEALAPKSPRESEVTMTQLILPPDANAFGEAFGGRIMEWIDVCGAIAAQRHCRQVVVTASMDDLHFQVPIKVGWIAMLHARVLAAFNTSMEVGVTVTSENPVSGERRITTGALLTFVALNREGQKVRVPPLRLETEDDRRAFQEAEQRRADRRARKETRDTWQRVIAPGA